MKDQCSDLDQSRQLPVLFCSEGIMWALLSRQHLVCPLHSIVSHASCAEKSDCHLFPRFPKKSEFMSGGGRSSLIKKFISIVPRASSRTLGVAYSIPVESCQDEGKFWFWLPQPRADFTLSTSTRAQCELFDAGTRCPKITRGRVQGSDSQA